MHLSLRLGPCVTPRVATLLCCATRLDEQRVLGPPAAAVDELIDACWPQLAGVIGEEEEARVRREIVGKFLAPHHARSHRETTRRTAPLARIAARTWSAGIGRARSSSRRAPARRDVTTDAKSVSTSTALTRGTHKYVYTYI